MKTWAGLIGIALGACLAATGAFAADAAWDACASGSGDRSIAGCTEVIGRGQREAQDKRARAHNNRGVEYELRGDLDRAIADYSDAVRTLPGYAMGYKNRGDTHRKKGDLDRAIADYNEAIRLNPKYAAAYTERGVAYRRKGEFDRAVSDHSQAIRIDPKYAIAYNNRGVAYEMKGDLDRAIPDYDEAIRLNPKYAVAYNNRADVYRKKNDLDRAVADYGEAIRIDPKYAVAYDNRGDIHRQKGDFDQAIADYSEAIRSDPKLASAHGGRGEAHRLKRDYDRAIADASEAIRLDPKYAFSWRTRGAAYVSKGESDRAIADLSEALQINPKSAFALDNRGQAYEQKGDFGRAVADYEASLAVSPQHAWTQNALGRARSAAASLATPGPVPQQHPAPNPPAVTTPGRRVALVIGNGAYRHATALPNPSNDAVDLAGALRDLGFTVIEGRDLDANGLRLKVRDFTRTLDRADLALFYYAGHAVQVAGKNYLVPVEADLQSAADLDFSAIEVGRIIGGMEAEGRVSLVLLDACRDNPFTRSLRRSLGTRSSAVGQGLAPIPVAPASGAFGSAAGTLIAFATQPDNVALDGEGQRNSPFTAALLKHIRTPGLEVEALMRRVRTEVASLTKGRQVPRHDSGIVGGDVVLAAAKP